MRQTLWQFAPSSFRGARPPWGGPLPLPFEFGIFRFARAGDALSWRAAHHALTRGEFVRRARARHLAHVLDLCGRAEGVFAHALHLVVLHSAAAAMARSSHARAHRARRLADRTRR